MSSQKDAETEPKTVDDVGDADEDGQGIPVRNLDLLKNVVIIVATVLDVLKDVL